jgi:hypothetical protein
VGFAGDQSCQWYRELAERGRDMSAGAISFLAIVTGGGALFSLAFFERTDRNGLVLGALAVGAVAGIALTVSSFLLMDGWAERMEHFDFSGFEPTVNAGRTSNGGGPMFAIYFWPYESAALGAFATFAFGRELWCRVRSPNG